MDDYLMKEVYPKFTEWVSKQTEVVEADKKHGQYFIAHFIDPLKVECRGHVYDFAESIENHIRFSMHEAPANQMHHHNAINLALSISWAVQHDGFDEVKYTPFSSWGEDIHLMAHDGHTTG